jgi:hypothetical protein
MNRLDERVWPKDCAFLVSLPTNRKDFFSDLEDSGKDFVRAYFGNVQVSAEAKWGAYRPVAEDMESLMSDLHDKGVQVRPRATLADWRGVQPKCKVVILFTHWRSGLLRQEDVHWDRLAEKQFQSENTNESRLTAVIRQIKWRTENDQEGVVKRLNEFLRNGQLGNHPWFGKGPNQKPASEEHRIYINRKFLAEAYPGIFSGSTSAEFAEGLIPIDQISSAVLANYSGIFDLSVCNSVLLAEMIKEQASGCLAIAPRLPAELDFRIIFYRAVFKILKRGRPYIPTIEDLRERLLKLMLEEI